MDRNRTLEKVKLRKEPWDVVVIGGGATGVGCALDAASRGLDVLLLEQNDFGKGTSSRSTKLVHGGVRYLAQGNISLVREALRGRAVLLKNAPHVVRKQAFVVPCYSFWQKFYYGVGLKIYDLLSGKYSFGKSQMLSGEETLERLPTIKPEGLAGGVLYYDGQFDDTRLLIDIARTADSHGACLLNYAPVLDLLEGSWGEVVGVKFGDYLNGREYKVRSRCVINAAGPFVDSVRKMSVRDSEPLITHSQGIHLVLERKFLPGDSAIMIPKTSDGRVLFCIPWNGHTLVGTTDTPIGKPELEPKALSEEIEFVLETAGEYLAVMPRPNDILSVFVGIRPLVRSSAAKNTAALSRGHTIEIDDHGLVTITGGKWTTYRKMAEETIDVASDRYGLSRVDSKTKNLAIQPPERSAETERLHPLLPYNVGDVLMAVRDEMAQTIEDVLARRTRALFLNSKAAIELAPTVARIISAELGVGDEWVANQIREFNELARSYSAHETEKLKL